MMSTTLVSNGATVYIIGPVQADLDRYATHAPADTYRRLTLTFRTAKLYNDAAEKTGKPGRMYGIQGDISKKVSIQVL